MQSIEIRGEEIEYLKFGNGPKNLIMIQGLSFIKLSGSVGRRERMASFYENDFTVYFVERRPNMKKGTSTRDMAAHIAEFMDAIGIKKATIAGFSQGGMIAQWLAIDYPEKIEALVLTVTYARPNVMSHSVQVWSDLIKAKEYEHFLRLGAFMSYSADWLYRHKDVKISVPDECDRRSAEQYEICADACITHDTYDQLDKIKCPILAIGGKVDLVVSLQGTLDIAEKTGCEKVVYDDMGHGLYEEDRDFHKKVYSWLNKTICNS